MSTEVVLRDIHTGIVNSLEGKLLGVVVTSKNLNMLFLTDGPWKFVLIMSSNQYKTLVQQSGRTRK